MKLCKVYSLSDSHDADPLWQELLEEMCPDWKSAGPIHRKYWEWGLGLYGLHKLGCIKPDAVALGVGAGVEWPLFYLANRIHRVYATDLYSVDSFFMGPDPTVPEHVEKIAPFPWRRESLIFQKMDALDLKFDDDTFDFVFSFSSIEHFGGHPGATLSMQEIARVLKPGGVAAIATELIIKGPRHYEFFMPADVEPCLVAGSGMELVEPLDLSIDAEMISNPVVFEFPPGYTGNTGPHTSVRCGDLTFTSIQLFLRKPETWKPAPLAASGALQARMHAGRFAVRARQSIGPVIHAIRSRRYIPPIVRRAVKRVIRRPDRSL
jgi:SAM-dependent methyltransferase